MTSGARQAAFVTGAGRGIGFAAALHLAGRGFDIALNDLSDDAALEAGARQIAETGVKVVRVAGDVSVISGHAAMLGKAEAEIGPLTTLINNAGVSVLERGDPLDVSEASYDRCMAVNAKAMFFMCQAFARRVVEHGGDGGFHSIVNISSSNAVAVAVPRAEYCVSKAAAAMISKLFAVRLGKEGVAVYDVQPGLIETDMTRTVKDTYQRRIDDEGLTLFPRLGQPEDVGRIIAALACGDLPYTTGQVISADAGMLVSRF